MDGSPSDSLEAAVGLCCDGTDQDAGARVNGNSSLSGVSGASAHALAAVVVCQPLLECQEAQATLDHCYPLGSGGYLFLGMSPTSLWRKSCDLSAVFVGQGQNLIVRRIITSRVQ